MRRFLALSAAVMVAGCASRSPRPDATAPSSGSPSAAATPPAPPAQATAPPPQPASYLAPSPFSGGDGSSVEQAVVVLAGTEDEGIDLEHHWIFDHYGRFRKIGGGLGSADGKHYDVITVELGDHTEKTIYFDITGFYGVMELPEAPAPPPPPR